MPIPVGIDIGNAKCVIAASVNGVVSVLQNEESYHETPTLVYFAGNHRLFGSAGSNFAVSNPSATVSQLKRLVGRRFDDPHFQKERARLPYETSRGSDGVIAVKVMYMGEMREFTATEVLAMLLSHLRRKGEAVLGSSICECVIGVPAYFTGEQKKAYADAAKIAGWNPLALLHEGTASALDYRAGRSPSSSDSIVVAFVDIGHSDTQVTVASFQGGKLRVIAEACSPHLGGRDFDDVIFKHFAQELRSKQGIDVLPNVKASARLRMACEKAKRILSANVEAHINVDALMDGIDAKGSLTRVEFDNLSSSLLRKVAVVFRKALKTAELAVDDLYAVELLGSGSRIPAISATLSQEFGKGLSRTLNGSESIASGCALQCQKLLSSTLEEAGTGGHGRRRSRSATLSNEFVSNGISTNHISDAREREEQMAKQDQQIADAQASRNTLEGYVYKSRNKIMKNEGARSTSEKNEIISKLIETEEWLQREEEDGPSKIYEDRFGELKLLVSPETHLDDASKGEGSREQGVDDGRSLRRHLMSPSLEEMFSVKDVDESLQGPDQANLEEISTSPPCVNIEGSPSRGTHSRETDPMELTRSPQDRLPRSHGNEHKSNTSGTHRSISATEQTHRVTSMNRTGSESKKRPQTWGKRFSKPFKNFKCKEGKGAISPSCLCYLCDRCKIRKTKSLSGFSLCASCKDVNAKTPSRRYHHNI